MHRRIAPGAAIVSGPTPAGSPIVIASSGFSFIASILRASSRPSKPRRPWTAHIRNRIFNIPDQPEAQATPSPMIETRDLTKKYGDLFAVQVVGYQARAGRRVRLHRPQRLGQDDHDAHARHAAESDLGRSLRLRLFDLHQAEGDSPAGRLHARFLRRLRRHEGDRVSRILRGRLSDQGPAAPQGVQRSARSGRPRLQARRTGHQPVARHDAAARPGPRAAARSASAAAGRTGQRPRPARAHRDSPA